MTPERLKQIDEIAAELRANGRYKAASAIADLLAERETLEADARRWRHLEKIAFCDGNGGDWCVEVWPHHEVHEFTAAVDQDIERTAMMKRP